MWQNIFEPQHLKWRWFCCISIGIYLYLFVTFCEPFKGDEITYAWASIDAYRQHSLLNFTLTVLSCAVSLIFLPHYFPHYFLPEKLTLKRFGILVVLTALIIEIGYFLANNLFFHHGLSLDWFLTYMFKVTCTSFFFIGIPYVFLYFLGFNYFVNLRNKALNLFEIPQLEDAPTSTSENEIIELTELAPP